MILILACVIASLGACLIYSCFQTQRERDAHADTLAALRESRADFRKVALRAAFLSLENAKVTKDRDRAHYVIEHLLMPVIEKSPVYGIERFSRSLSALGKAAAS